MVMKLWALWALAGTASALFPVIVPMSDNANDTQLTWGPVTADISANRCRAFVGKTDCLGASSDFPHPSTRSKRRLGADGDVEDTGATSTA